MKLWIYTEERPRVQTILEIVKRFSSDNGFKIYEKESIKIIPIFKDNFFQFTYIIKGLKCDNVEDILIKTVKGYSSFVDYLVFYQSEQPGITDNPIYLIEETKTDDSESRNTGVYQRSSKFVYSNFFYPQVKKIMLYNLKIRQKEKPTPTSIFGTKMLLTLNVDIMGKKLDSSIFKKFISIEEFIKEKNSMRAPFNGVPVKVTKTSDNIIEISAKLENGGRLGNDPSIGMTTIMSACLRVLGWQGRIVITNHGLINQRMVGVRNKFILIANLLEIELEGLEVPRAGLPPKYWDTEVNQEKVGTIFTSILCEEFSNSIPVYENHGGCERGYFIVPNDQNKDLQYIAIRKFSDRKKYKAGDKKYIVNIPDVVIYDKTRNTIINGEGKTLENKDLGISELKNFDYLEENYVNLYFPGTSIERTLILYGGDSTIIEDPEVGLLLNSFGQVILGKNAPEVFKEALYSLLCSQ